MKIKNETIEEKIMYRTPMQVREIIIVKSKNAYPICPKCNYSFEREYQAYCDKCGQALKWTYFSRAKVRKA